MKVLVGDGRRATPAHHARGADFVLLTTRCATHADTGFIHANVRGDAAIVYADGSGGSRGSASLLRATLSRLTRLISRRGVPVGRCRPYYAVSARSGS